MATKMTREEAIKIVQSATVWTDEERDALAMLIPELAESEDERIRKWLVNYFSTIKEMIWIHRDITCEQILDWLEKQKECVSNNFDDVWAEEDCEEIIAEGKKLTPRFKELLKEVCHAWYDRGAKLEKQKEQKHPNGCFTCDEYKKGYEAGRLNGFTAGYNKAMKEQKPDSITKYVYSKDDKKFIQDCANILVANDCPTSAERLLSMFEEQKLSEWSPTNEDVILFNKAVTTNQNLTPSERAKLDIIRMKFKHCNGQIATNDFDIALGERYIQGYNDGINESKPAEWSEGDENMLWNIISIVGESKSIQADEMLNWLKSLRPSWKPNEKHLSALLAVFNDPNNIGSQTCQLALTDLYEQLKKL